MYIIYVLILNSYELIILRKGEYGLMTLPIVLDTDIGYDPDDLLALAMILDRSEFDLRAVITTGKNPELRALMVQHLCNISGNDDVLIGIGSTTETSKEPTELHKAFFSDEGVDLSSKSVFHDSVDILNTVLSPAVTVITIGPLTSLADYISTNPPAIVNIKRVVSMGGFISRKSGKCIREYNFGSDPSSTRVVLNQGFEHICVTKNVCGKILMKPEDLASAILVNSPARSFAFSFMREWFTGREEKKLHDPFTAACAIYPDRLKLESVFFEIKDDGKCGGTIGGDFRKYAAVGGTPADIQWFFNMFYGEE